MAAPDTDTPAVRTAIVVPCYNEETRLPAETFKAFIEAHPEYAFCFVDDGSSDGTRAVLEALCRPFPDRARVYPMPKNGGKAEAVRAGILHAHEAWQAPWVGFWDADLATPLEEIPRFEQYLAERPRVRVLCGARWLHMGARIERHVWRHYIGRIFATAASNTLGLPIYDTQCGAKLVASEMISPLFTEPFASRWIFDVEMLARVIRHLGRQEAREVISEIALETWVDTSGSKVKPHHAFRIPLDLWRIHRRYLAGLP